MRFFKNIFAIITTVCLTILLMTLIGIYTDDIDEDNDNDQWVYGIAYILLFEIFVGETIKTSIKYFFHNGLHALMNGVLTEF